MSGSERKSLDKTTIVVALIGLAGTIVAAIITTRGLGPSTPATAQPIAVTTEAPAPTAVAEASATVESQAPATADLPTATNTSAPLLAAGEDWNQNCIGAVWQAYPTNSDTTLADGCYVNLFNSIFSAVNGRLTFFFEQRVDSREASGIFTELPSNSLVTLNIHLDDLRTGEVWIGVFEQPDINSNGYVLAMQPGNPKDTAFNGLSMPGESVVYPTGKFAKDSGNYLVSLDVSPNSVFGIIEVYTKTNTFPLSSEKKWLFLGYHALTPGTNRIEGYFSDLDIASR